MDLGRGAIDTPLGRMVVTASEEGVRRLEWGDAVSYTHLTLPTKRIV